MIRRLVSCVSLAALAPLLVAGAAHADTRSSEVQRDPDRPVVVGEKVDQPPRGQVEDTNVTRVRYRADDSGVLVARIRLAREVPFDARNYFDSTSVQARTVQTRRYVRLDPDSRRCPDITLRRVGGLAVLTAPRRCLPRGPVDLRVDRTSNLNGTTLRDTTEWLRFTVRR